MSYQQYVSSTYVFILGKLHTKFSFPGMVMNRGTGIDNPDSHDGIIIHIPDPDLPSINPGLQASDR